MAPVTCWRECDGLCWTDCSRLRRTAQLCNTVQHSATQCNTQCNTVQHSAAQCSTVQHSAPHCNTVQHSATLYNALQHTATHCNTYWRDFGHLHLTFPWDSWEGAHCWSPTVTWLIHTCDVTRIYVRRDLTVCDRIQSECARRGWHYEGRQLRHDSFICVTKIMHTCDVTDAYVCHDSFICAVWLIDVCDMTQIYVRHDSIMRATGFNQNGLMVGRGGGLGSRPIFKKFHETYAPS